MRRWKITRHSWRNYKTMLACKILEAFVEIGRSYVSTETVAYVEEQPRSYRNVQEMLNYLNRGICQGISRVSFWKRNSAAILII